VHHSGTRGTEEVQQVGRTFDEALRGSGVPFAVRVATYDETVLFQVNRW
jgi:hypothetical protein